MTDIYNGIPNSSLQWLDRLSGKTGAELPAAATTAPQGWLPPEVASRLVSGKTYILTVGSEVLALTAPNTLERGLEGTTSATHDEGTDVYQGMTAHQLMWLVQKLSAEGGDADWNDTANPDLDDFTLSVGEFSPGMYGYYAGGVGGLTPASSEALGEISGIMWSTGKPGNFAFLCEKYHANGLQVVINGNSYIAKQVGTGHDGHGYEYSVRVARNKYAEQTGDAAPAALDALPKSGAAQVRIGPSLWKGYQGINTADEFTFRLWVGEHTGPGLFHGYQRGTSDIGYLEPGFFAGHPGVKVITWHSAAAQMFLEFEDDAPGGFAFPSRVEVTVDGVSGIFEQQHGYSRQYFAYPANPGDPGRELYDSLPSGDIDAGISLPVTIRYIRD